MIKVKDISYQYPSQTPINFPSFEVQVGKPLLIMGESGCGKTTLLHLLAGLLQPNTGEIHIDGTALAQMNTSAIDQFRGQHIGIVFQQSYFIGSLSILDNLLLSPFSGTKDRAKVVTERLSIKNVLNRYPHQLSVGQQQRVTIARAVMNSPKLLLADEPTSALDNKNCAQVIELLQEEAAANNAALIIVTHDDRLRSEISDRLELLPIESIK